MRRSFLKIRIPRTHTVAGLIVALTFPPVLRGACAEVTRPAKRHAIVARQQQSQERLDRALLEAAGDGDIARIAESLRKGANINSKGGEGVTPLMRVSETLDDGNGELAERHGLPGALKSLRAFELILFAGPDVNARDDRGFTALMFACSTVSLPAIKKLIERGADVNAKTVEGYTALLVATGSAGDGHKSPMSVEIVRHLLAKGANPNARETKEGSTPLILTLGPGEAGAKNAAAIVKMLIAEGADVNARSKNGNTALKWAQARKYTAVARLLEKAGARL